MSKIDEIHGSENQGAEAEFVLHTIALNEPWGECVLLITTTLGSSMLKVLVTKGGTLLLENTAKVL